MSFAAPRGRDRLAALGSEAAAGVRAALLQLTMHKSPLRRCFENVRKDPSRPRYPRALPSIVNRQSKRSPP